MSISEKTNQDKHKKTVYKETEVNTENDTNGETSSVANLDRSAFTKKPARQHKPLGSSHEPGVMPGTET
ncbi:hypothetical protein [Pedobacter frigoris]|uniref:Uncharacterized protein n=1 Tax=Pedobacter frigoris TaxID=2571272 RepID=A0A4U1CCV9_9SPHI|nr:hypothetical protein [Pedobacter frigoris]TKC03979.1 hypothetical protein FA047_18730 [Pedobacter frigoris]